MSNCPISSTSSSGALAMMRDCKMLATSLVACALSGRPAVEALALELDASLDLF